MLIAAPIRTYDGLKMHFIFIFVGFILALSTAAQAQVMPRPIEEPATPRAVAPAAPGEPRRQAAQPRAAAPNTPCQHVTKGWADYRPQNDSPVAQGRASSGEIYVALDACESEQAAAPSDRRIAFLLARAFEVSGKGSRATPMFRQLSDGGFAPATTQLARAYAIGSGVAPNQTTACDLYLIAARAGDIWAMNPAANCLSFQDYPHDARLACRYFQRAEASGTFQNTNLSRQDYCQ